MSASLHQLLQVCSSSLCIFSTILTHNPKDLRDMEIQESLQGARTLRAKDLHLITSQECFPTKGPQITKSLASQLSSQEINSKKPVMDSDWLGRKRSALMVVASLIATVAFQAGITPPGGVWQDDLQVDSNGNPVEIPHTAGTSIMAYNQKIEYGQFMIFNTIAFLSSLSIILLLVSVLPIKRRRWKWLQMIIKWIAITAQVVTYFVSLRYMSPESVHNISRDVIQVSVLSWLCLMGVVFIGNVIRMNLWVLRKHGCIKAKEGAASAKIEENQEEV